MAQKDVIPAECGPEELGKLLNLSASHLRNLAREGVIPKPQRGLYQVFGTEMVSASSRPCSSSTPWASQDITPMPAKWNKRVFWLKYYEGKISCASFELADAANMRPL
jgi:hypothetical protein